MEQKRFILFIVLSMGVLFGWTAIAPKLGLAPQRRKPDVVQKDVARREAAPAGGEEGRFVGAGAEVSPDDRLEPQAGPADTPLRAEPEGAAGKVVENAGAPEQPPAHEPKTVILGSMDFDSGFRQLVTLSSRGAAVAKIELNDKRYRALAKPHPPLEVVGNGVFKPLTLETAVPQMRASAYQNWELADVQPAEPPHSSATFVLQAGGIEAKKRYELAKIADPEHEGPGYELKMELSFRNLSGEPRVVNYELQGPTGVPLENVDNTQKFRDVVVGFGSSPGRVTYQTLSATAIAEGKTEQWQKPVLDYIGVDVQYFAALVIPAEDQRTQPYIQTATQEVVGVPATAKEKTDISVRMTSLDLDLAPANDPAGKDRVSHVYNLFAGPKREDVLPPGTSDVIDYGSFLYLFRFGAISRFLVGLLKVFYSVFGSWGVAIICLTVVVRGAMFPLSIKQARGAAKMQELQPELQALKEKYGKDKEKFARAQMELFSKHNYNPFAGCLPIFLQMPVFIALYAALNHAVDLRMAKFLWIDNLAAPDALFQFGRALPILGWKEFNLLPFITIALFIVQQKMFMPPPTNEEQALQQKMMNFMMVFMGVMFYKVPAGLCVYFIASSLWGLAERKLLPKPKPRTDVPPAPPTGGAGGERRKPVEPRDGDDDGDKPLGFWAKLLKAAEKETSARRAAPAKRK